MTTPDNLPPLPKPIGWAAEPDLALKCAGVFLRPRPEQLRAMIDAGWVGIYTAAQVEEIRRAAILAERERCAKVCDAIAKQWMDIAAKCGGDDAVEMNRAYCAEECAAAIRKGDK